MKYLLTVAMLATSLMSASAFASKGCEAQYSVDGGSTWTAFKYLGEVRGGVFNTKKKKCFDMAKKNASVKAAGAKLPAVAAGHCTSGIKVYTRVNVEGKKNEGTESFTMKPSCKYGNGDCAQYEQVLKSGKWK